MKWTALLTLLVSCGVLTRASASAGARHTGEAYLRSRSAPDGVQMALAYPQGVSPADIPAGFLSEKDGEILKVIHKVHSVVHKEPARIAIASQCGGEYFHCEEGEFTKAFANHQAYAQKHGYEYFLLNSPLSDRLDGIKLIKNAGDPGISPWDRYPLIAHLHSRGAEWVLFVEADALFMNPRIGVEDFVQEHGQGKDLIASGDQNDHYLAGNVLMRKSTWMHSSMCKAWKVCPSPGFDQLGAMMTILGGGDPNNQTTWHSAYSKVWGRGVSEKEQSDEMQRLPQETRDHVMLLPQQAMNSYDQNLKDGDWIVHFAGKHNKRELVAKFADQANMMANKTNFLRVRKHIFSGRTQAVCGDFHVRLSGWDCQSLESPEKPLESSPIQLAKAEAAKAEHLQFPPKPKAEQVRLIPHPKTENVLKEDAKKELAKEQIKKELREANEVAQEQLADAKRELEADNKKLADAKRELEAAKKDLLDANANKKAAEEQLADHNAKLSIGQLEPALFISQVW